LLLVCKSRNFRSPRDFSIWMARIRKARKVADSARGVQSVEWLV